MNPEKLIIEQLDVWTKAIETRSTSGRGSRSKLNLYGIKKLRELILDLAVRGQLVPQDPNDEPACVLLDKIAAEKELLIKAGKIKKQKALPPIGEDEKPFELPEGWEWTKLKNIAEINPKNVIDDQLEVAFVPMPMILTSYDGCHEQDTKLWGKIKKGYTHFADGDIAVAKITPCFENSKAAIFNNLKNGVGAGTTELHIARPFDESISRQYILLYLKAPLFLRKGEKRMTGTAGQKRLPRDFFESNPLPIPPLAEQHRIVAKVNELMSLCDALEQAQTQHIQAHQTLVENLLAALTQAANQGDFEQAWARIAEHFDTLFTTEHSIDQLKQTLLQLAVMGKLVPQDPNDEPASVLLEKIAAEKARLIKEKKIKKQKALPPITDEEKPFELPNGWEWCRLGHYANEIGTGPFGTMIHKNEYITNGIPLINPSHIINSTIVEDPTVSVSLKKAEELAAYKVKAGDIVMARRGELGRCGLITNRESNWLCGTGSFVLRFHSEVLRKYFITLFQSRSVRNYLGGNSIGSTMTNLNHGILNKAPIPLPPTAEQYRIVAKVNELITLCDQLKTQLAKQQTTQNQLADALTTNAYPTKNE